MKNTLYIFLLSLFLYGCGATQDRQMTDSGSENDTIKIGSEDMDFQLLVFDSDFDTWLSQQPPMETYNLGYLERKNRVYTDTYNRRARSPERYGRLYPQPINYDSDQDYGLKLNYMLFMYYEFFQEKYNQRL